MTGESHIINRRMASMTRIIAAMLLFLAVASAQPMNGVDVIKEMHEKYGGLWYSDLTFKQQSFFFKDGKVDREETWYEAIKMPKGLLIKIGSKDAGTGYLFRNDSQYAFRDNAMVQGIRRVHDLLVLGFFVYADPPAETIRRLRESGFDLEHCAVEHGEKGDTFVVGEAGQPQFWVTSDTFLFTKLKKTDGRGNEIEVQFNKYRRIGKGWISAEVVFLRNGQTVMKEEYTDVAIDVNLPESMFETSDFKSATW